MSKKAKFNLESCLRSWKRYGATAAQAKDFVRKDGPDMSFVARHVMGALARGEAMPEFEVNMTSMPQRSWRWQTRHHYVVSRHYGAAPIWVGDTLVRNRNGNFASYAPVLREKEEAEAFAAKINARIKAAIAS